MINKIMLTILFIVAILYFYYCIKLYQIDKDKVISYSSYFILGLIANHLDIDLKVRGAFIILLTLFITYKMKKQVDLFKNTNQKNRTKSSI